MSDGSHTEMYYHQQADDNSMRSVSYNQQNFPYPNPGLIVKSDLESKDVCVLLDVGGTCPSCTGKFRAKIISSHAKLSVSRRGQSQRKLAAQQNSPAIESQRRHDLHYTPRDHSRRKSGAALSDDCVYTPEELQRMGYYQPKVNHIPPNQQSNHGSPYHAQHKQAKQHPRYNSVNQYGYYSSANQTPPNQHASIQHLQKHHSSSNLQHQYSSQHSQADPYHQTKRSDQHCHQSQHAGYYYYHFLIINVGVHNIFIRGRT